jgi:hypothetical protein
MSPEPLSKLFNSLLWPLTAWLTVLSPDHVLSRPTVRMKGYTPYLNTSICLVPVPATALVYPDGVKLAAGWPTPMPTLVPDNAPCFPVRAAIPSTPLELSPSATPSSNKPAAGDLQFGPCGVSDMVLSHRLKQILTQQFYYCQLPGWKGECYHQAIQPSQLNACMQLEDWQSRFSAFGPDYNTIIDLYR